MDLTRAPRCSWSCRTVTVGHKGKDRDKPLTYVPRPLDELTIGIQRIAVICPVEEQNEIRVDNSIEGLSDGDNVN